MKFTALNQKVATYNGRDYINADSIEYNGTTIYHLVADNDDLYCYLKANDVGYRTSLIPISDESILQNVISIFTPATMTAQVSNIAKDESMRAYQDNTNGNTNIKYFNEKPIDEAKEEKILAFVSDGLKALHKKGYQFNIEKMLGKIKAVKFFEATIDNDALGFFIEEDREIVLDRNILENLEDEEKRRFLLRQVCFAIAGSDYTSKIFENDNRTFSMVDGKLNKICEDAFTQEKTSTIKVLKDINGIEEGRVEFDFSDAVQNKEAMAIINQMSYLTGLNSGDDIFNGKNNLDSAFINMYGKQLYNYLAARINRLTSETKGVPVADYNRLDGKAYADYYKETQDTLMCEVFNKELEELVSAGKKIDAERAILYFERLQGFKQHRGNVISVRCDRCVHDKSFDTYYSVALNRVCREMAKENKDEADKMYERFHRDFEEQQDVDEINKRFKSLITGDMTKTEIDELSKMLKDAARDNSKVVIERGEI